MNQKGVAACRAFLPRSGKTIDNPRVINETIRSEPGVKGDVAVESQSKIAICQRFVMLFGRQRTELVTVRWK